MKNTSFNQKAAQGNQQDVDQTASAGPNGAAITPPVYGIDFLDRGSVQAGAGPRPNGGSALQRKADPSAAGDDAGTRPENRTGLPDALKTGIESISGLEMDD